MWAILLVFLIDYAILSLYTQMNVQNSAQISVASNTHDNKVTFETCKQAMESTFMLLKFSGTGVFHY